MDQNACSSPHLVLWLMINLKKLKFFWRELSNLLKKYEFPDIASIDKYSMLCADILEMENIKSYKKIYNLISLITLKSLNSEIIHKRGKWGYFYEYHVKDLNDVLKFVDKSCQTLSYFGV